MQSLESINSQHDKQKAYFAADTANECASNLLNKARSFHTLMQSNAYLLKIKNMWYYYHGQFNQNSHEVGYTGEQGELLTLNVNHFRNIGEHIINMILSSRPTMQARAINTDYKSLAQTYLANGILDYYMREKGMEDAIKRAVEYAVVLGAGYVRMEWNATAGEDYETDDQGNIIKEGEIEFSNLSPLDVIFDGTKETWDHNWLMVRTFKNRFDLIAKYPEFEEQIRAIPAKNDNQYRIHIFSNDDTDDIPVYEFYHKKTDSLPEGRYMLFLSPDAILIDTVMPYRRIPIFRLTPSDFLGTCYGYTSLFDLYPIQEAVNSLYGSVLTNNTAFAVQSVFVPKGSDISIASVEGGMNFIEGNAKPEPIQLTNSSIETYKLIEVLEGTMETISAVSSVTRGNPEASLKSGSALALVQSMSLQFISKFQQSYVRLIENLGTGLIEMLKDFATAPKVIAVVGKNNRSLLKEFTGEDISAINRVIVDVGNPLARSTAGRVQMAEQLAQMNLLKSSAEYFQVINTGNIDTVYEDEMSQILLIRGENEKMMEGQQVLTTFLDDHRQHILEHRAVIADPELRNNPVLLDIVLGHIQEHIEHLRNTDPQTLQIINQVPLNPMGTAGIPLPPEMMDQMQNSSQPGPNSAGPQNAPANTQMPKMPEVPANVLPSPEMQEQAMGNVQY